MHGVESVLSGNLIEIKINDLRSLTGHWREKYMAGFKKESKSFKKVVSSLFVLFTSFYLATSTSFPFLH